MNDSHGGAAEEPHDLPWYCKAFEAGYLNLYAHRNSKDAARALAFLEHHVELKDDLRLLDLCCGAGRHLALIGPRLGRAAGLDLSRVLLTEAKQTLTLPSGPQRRQVFPLMEADMRRLPIRTGYFDLVINLFTSFGYFDDEAENEAVIAEVARVLGPRGIFVFDHINRSYLEQNLQKESRRTLGGDVEVVERRRIDSDTDRVHKDVHWSKPGSNPIHWHESVRLYTPDEMTRLIQNAGLDVKQTFGDFDGRALTDDAPRMIFTARRTG